jgi:tetratricopeptide (TPR) repeat protein
MAKSKQKTDKSPKVKLNAPAWFTNAKLHMIIIGVFAAVLYVNTLGHQYALDDSIVIIDNDFTKKGISGIGDIMRYDTFRGFFKVEGKDKLVSGGRYRPFTLVMFAAGISMWGEKPGISHFINLLLYAGIGIMLYLWIGLLLKNKRAYGYGWFIALATALLFVAHPVHTECVANIKGRDEIMALLGSIVAAYFMLKSYLAKGKSNTTYIGIACLAFLIALFSKENTITFLGVVPLMLFIFTKANLGEAIIKSLPLLVPTVLFIIVRTMVIGFDVGGDPPKEMMNNPFIKIQGNGYIPFTGGEKLATIFYTLLRYLGLLVAPYPLTHDYYPRHIAIMNFGNWQAILSVIIHFALLVYGLMLSAKKNILGFGILYYIGTLFIVSNLLFPVGTNMAERFIFMPSVGFCFVVAVLLHQLFVKIEKGRAISFSNYRIPLGMVSAVAIIFGVMTIARNPVWENNMTLFVNDADISVNSAKLQNSVGGELVTKSVEEKDETKRKAMINKAIGHLNQAIKIHPNYKNAYLLLGNAYNYLQDYDKSISFYEHALSLDPNYKDANSNLAVTYRSAGRYYGEQKNDLNKALSYLTKAEQANPQDLETIRLLGVVYGMSGNSDKAISYFTKVTTLQPNNASAWLNLGNAYGQAGDTQKAESFRRKAMAIDPNVLK